MIYFLHCYTIKPLRSFSQGSLMIKAKTLKEVIETFIPIKRRTNLQGWHPVLCKVCNDHGRKGNRAGFRFDHDIVIYNCFNCGHTAVYNPHENKTMPEKMKMVLDAFHVPQEEWQQVVFTALSLTKGGDYNQQYNNTKSIEPPAVSLPDFFYQLSDDPKDEMSQCAIEYLKTKRGINWKDYPFMLAKITNHPDSKRWFGRLIIPFFKDNKLIFYQGRDLTDTRPQKYLNASVNRENVLYGFEFLNQNTDEPLYIVEGWFDAFLIQGIAVLGRKISDGQLRWINSSPRPKVIIPDKTGKGFDLALMGLEKGWAVSTPDVGDCKDVSEAVVRYGLVYTLMSIKQHTYKGFEAKTRIKVYCK